MSYPYVHFRCFVASQAAAVAAASIVCALLWKLLLKSIHKFKLNRINRLIQYETTRMKKIMNEIIVFFHAIGDGATELIQQCRQQSSHIARMHIWLWVFGHTIYTYTLALGRPDGYTLSTFTIIFYSRTQWFMRIATHFDFRTMHVCHESATRNRCEIRFLSLNLFNTYKIYCSKSDCVLSPTLFHRPKIERRKN